MGEQQNDRLADLAAGWDAGYEAAAQVFESGILRVATQGMRGLDGMTRPANPYRIKEAR